MGICPSYHPPALSVTTDQKDTEYIGGWEAARKVTGINEGVGMKMLKKALFLLK